MARMQVVYCEDELLHNPLNEMTGGVWKAYVESPKRLVSIKNFIDNQPEFQVVDPNDYSLGPILDVHRKDYIEFLQTIYNDWVTEGFPANACMGETFAHPSVVGKIDPEIVRKTANLRARGKIGYYTCDMSVCFVKGNQGAIYAAIISYITALDTWRATYASAQVAISAAHRLTLAIDRGGDQAIYALCRPPGHHSSHQMAAGYCFINNAAVVARFMQNYTLDDMNKAKKPYGFNLDAMRNREFSAGTATEKKKILIVDIDYHHGNGTQDIFYDDPSVFYTSLHGCPDYPYFTGSAEETGRGKGVGYNINVPLDPKTTTDDIYLDNLERVLNNTNVIDFNADIVIVSMGLDTWHEDPIAGMKGLQDINTYKKMGYLIKTCQGSKKRPVLFVQEGGYTIEKLGDLASSVLQGYLNSS